MDFTGQRLAHLQGVAGYFSLTINEVINRLQSPPEQPNEELPRRDPSSPQHHGPLFDSTVFYRPGELESPSQDHQGLQGWSNPDTWAAPNAGYFAHQHQHHPQQQHHHHYYSHQPPRPLQQFQEYQYVIACNQPPSSAPATTPATPAEFQSRDADAILLNPGSVPLFQCDTDFAPHFVPFLDDDSPLEGENYSLLQAASYDTSSYVEISEESGHVSEGESETVAVGGHDDEEDCKPAMDWEMVSASSTSIMTTGGKDQPKKSNPPKYPTLAPKPGSIHQTSASSASSSASRKRRAAYSKTWRKETRWTRQHNACVRCRVQRNRVSIHIS